MGAGAVVPEKKNPSREPSPRQLRAFLVLAEELHFGRAARRLFMTQPSLSQLIRALERDLGVDLVDRTTRRVALSRAGRALLPEIRGVVEALDHLGAAARARAGTGRLVVGSSEAITSVDPVPSVLDRFRRRLPGVDLRIRRSGFDAATDLLEGEVDVAFLFLPVPDGIQHLPLATGSRCAALHADDPLARRDRITLADLTDRIHIGWSTRVPRVYRDHWACDPRPDGTPVRYSAHAVADYESSLLTIAMGQGIQLPPEEARLLYPRPGVAYVEVTDVTPWTAALAWLPARRDDPSVAALREAARGVLGAG